MRLSRCLALVLLLVGPDAHGLVTIGNEPACHYNLGAPNPIQRALNDGHRDIRLVDGITYVGSLVVSGTADVQVSGGYASCAAAANGTTPAPQARSTLVSSSAVNAAIVLVPATTRRRVVTLERIALRPDPAYATTGTGIAIGGALSARLVLSTVSGFKFDGGDGGGAVIAGQGSLDLESSSIEQNRARNGGGVHCNGGTLRIDSRSVLLTNRAIGAAPHGNGGGALLQACTLASDGRLQANVAESNGGIWNNEATTDGGGLHATGGFIDIRGGPFCASGACSPRPGGFYSNRAGGRGGAAFLTGGADLEIDFGWVAGNRAVVAGGAFHLEAQSALRFGGLGSAYPGFDRSNCYARVCEVMFDNQVIRNGAVAGLGGAVHAVDSSVVLADLLAFDHHALRGAVLSASGASSVILQQLAMLQRPGPASPAPGAHPLLFAGTSTADIRRSTLYSLLEESALIRLEGSANVQLSRSVVAAFADGTRPLSVFSGAIAGSCNARAGQAHPVLDGPVVTQADFDALMLSPSENSALLDRCDADGIPPGARDARGQPRVATRSAVVPVTPLDIGAFELPPELIFTHGFD